MDRYNYLLVLTCDNRKISFFAFPLSMTVLSNMMAVIHSKYIHNRLFLAAQIKSILVIMIMKKHPHDSKRMCFV